MDPLHADPMPGLPLFHITAKQLTRAAVGGGRLDEGGQLPACASVAVHVEKHGRPGPAAGVYKQFHWLSCVWRAMPAACPRVHGMIAQLSPA